MPSRSGAVTRPFRPQTRNTVRSLLADDVTWHNPGGNHLSGDHRGVDPAIGPFAKFFEDSGGTFKAGVHDILASDTHAVALITAPGSRGGKTMNSRGTHVVRITGGKLTESRAFDEDQRKAGEFWA
jgi:ketosteroid isomerase-like protein